jgi:hypothetical protein
MFVKLDHNVQDLFTFQWINPLLDEVPSFLGNRKRKKS